MSGPVSDVRTRLRAESERSALLGKRGTLLRLQSALTALGSQELLLGVQLERFLREDALSRARD